jgi:hypothetical protein
VNPCSRTAPCKTFAGAISKTAKDGEINALDPAGFGAVTITKSITIDGTGTLASILASGTTGVIINITDPGDTAKTVRLRGLTINGARTGIQGIRIMSANKVIIDDLVIDGFTKHGISFETSAPVQAFIQNTRISNNAGNGVNVAGGGTQLVMQSVQLTHNGSGLLSEKSEVTLIDSQVAHNGTGIQGGAGSAIRLANALVTHNATGLSVAAGGTITSFKNNIIQGNKKDGDAPSPGVPR